MELIKFNRPAGPRPVRAAEIHPTAVVHPDATLGVDVQIGPHAVVGASVRIGNGCLIGPTAAWSWATNARSDRR